MWPARGLMRPVQLFAYGTLLQPAVQLRVFGRTLEMRPAVLRGWRIVPRAVGGRYPAIVPAANAVTPGALLRLGAGHLGRADAYEEVPRLYRRKRVTVASAEGPNRCWVYVSDEPKTRGVAPVRRATSNAGP